MKFYVITDYTDPDRIPESLTRAASERNIETVVIRAPHTNFFDLPKLEKGDLLFRIGISDRAFYIEKLLISDEIAHFYRDALTATHMRIASYFNNKRAGLPVINSIPLLPNRDQDIQPYIDHLGGFPLIVKVVGGSKGVGVMRVDSIESLKSVLDFVRSSDSLVMLRSYVPHQYYGRVVVVGDEVAGSHRTFVMDNEFRTNAPGNIEENKQGFEFSEEIQKVAIETVHSTGVYFGGVDFLFQEDGSYYIAEINFPCGFGSTERIAGVDIAGKILNYLIARSQKITGN